MIIIDEDDLKLTQVSIIFHMAPPQSCMSYTRVICTYIKRNCEYYNVMYLHNDMHKIHYNKEVSSERRDQR